MTIDDAVARLLTSLGVQDAMNAEAIRTVLAALSETQAEAEKGVYWTRECMVAASARDAERRRADEAVALLRRLEHCDESPGQLRLPRCPVCLIRYDAPHAPDCELAALLKPQEKRNA